MVEEYISVTEDQDVVAECIPADTERYAFISHGGSGGGFKKDKYEEIAEMFANNGWNGVRYDSRGYGEKSDGEFEDHTTTSRIEDLEAVIEYYDPDEFLLYGPSFGGKPAFHAAVGNDYETLEGIAVRAPLTENEAWEDIDKKEGFSEQFAEDFGNYDDFSPVIDQLDVPVAFFHGTADKLVPIQYTREVAGDLAEKRQDEGTVSVYSRETPRDVDVRVHEHPGDVTVHVYDGEKHSFSDKAQDQMQDDLEQWLQETFNDH